MGIAKKSLSAKRKEQDARNATKRARTVEREKSVIKLSQTPLGLQDNTYVNPIVRGLFSEVRVFNPPIDLI